jgi:3-dehydroquinate synthase
MRGIKYLQIPTSLLAQVDASIGGKTGINFGQIKNFVGSFYNPVQVFICADFLKSLNEQEFLNGFSEVIKHSLITSKESLEKIKKTSQEILAKDADTLLKCIEESVQIKAQIVASDFKEKGARKYLNFGHTFAHGIESANYKSPIFHGHAVIIGMLMALKYSKELGFLQESSYELAKEVISHFNYNFTNIDLDAELIFEAMKSDKKNTETINLVLLLEIGEPFIYEEQSSETLKHYIKEFINDFKK